MKNIIRMIFPLLLALALIAVTFSCGKKVHKDHEEYIGEWHGTEGSDCFHKLFVEEDSETVWSKNGFSGCDYNETGKLRAGKNFLWLKSFKFRVIKEPSLIVPEEIDSSNFEIMYLIHTYQPTWTMTLQCANWYCVNEHITFFRK